jgi:3-oxoacyl-[acyl-carrier protein] reductase
MDLGIAGRKAIVCASSRGLGRACAFALAREGCEVVVNGLNEDRVRATAGEIATAFGRAPVAVVADVTTEEGRLALLEACPEPDILVTNNAGPAPGRLADWTPEVWRGALDGNMMAAILLIQAVLPDMRRRRFGRIVNITSAMVKSPQSPMALSTAARAGLTAFSKAVSRDAVRDNVTINNLLPERFDTDRIRFMARRLAEAKRIGREEALLELTRDIPAGRLGRPEEFGDACAFLCSAQAGYVTGQNLQLDGGAYQGLV